MLSGLSGLPVPVAGKRAAFFVSGAFAIRLHIRTAGFGMSLFVHTKGCLLVKERSNKELGPLVLTPHGED
jgi:hypothetical protein